MKVKVLHVIGGMGRGGAPSFIINNLMKMDCSKIQFDFLVRNNNCVFTDIIESKGGRVFEVPAFPRYLVKNYKATVDFFAKHGAEYDVMHVHANALYYILPLLLAKKVGIKKIILHSHNTQSNVHFLQPLHYLNKIFVSQLANVFLACGKEAGKWMFGNQPFEVINNAVDTTKFAFNDLSRSEIRTELNIPADAFVIGNVGRFELAKNHSLLVDIFYHFLQKHPKSLLLLVGDGSLKKEIEIKVKKLGISNSVYFAGVRGDIEKLYSAMDIMLMPSLFEGLPFVAIEAQCSGLKCLLSDAVTSEAVVTDLCDSESLEASIEQWCDKIELLMKKNVLRTEYSLIVAEKKYDINYTANRLQQIYTQH